MRISDWSSDVCSSDLMNRFNAQFVGKPAFARLDRSGYKIGGCGGAICTARVMTSCRLSVADATASAVAVNGQASPSAISSGAALGDGAARILMFDDD